MFAFKPRIETMARIFLIAVIVFNAFVPTTSSASAEGENEKTHPATKSNSDLANSITLGVPESWASSVHEEVSILSEQIAKQAQQQQADNPVRFRVEAEPAIYIPGQPISLKWKVQNLKSQDLANAEMVIHAPAGFTTTDPNPIYTPDSLISIPLSSKKEVSEWNVPAGAEMPIYFTLDLLINDDLITYQTVMIDQAKFSIDKNAGGNLKALNGKVEVDLPASALNESLDLDIRNPALQAQPSLSLTWQPVEIIAVGKDSKQNIDKFKAPIKLKVKYDETQLSNWDESAMTIYYYDPDFRDWFPMVTTVDTKNNTLTAYSDHLTVFDYKANNWQSQSLPTVDAFKVADFTGAGTYAINLWTPPGLSGLQPSLVLSYNSQVIDESSAFSQPSWIGMGWSLETGAITRNMHGTDSNPQDDTFSISAGGVSGSLLPINSVVSNGIITTTYNTADQSFTKVENIITSNSNTWVATTTDGAKYEFANVARTSITDTDGCSIAAQLDLVWRWSLTAVTNPRVRDANNNPLRLTYDYTVEQKNPAAGCYNEIAVYPASISYPNGKYSVSFVTENRNDYQTSWTQSTSRTLYGTKRLKEILVQHLGTTVRRYALSYALDTATSNVIYPNFKWSNNNAKTLTLLGVQEFTNNTNSPALPAVTFTYGDGLHLTDVDNGQGGKVNLLYAPWDYYNDVNDSLRSLYTIFGDPASTNPECIYSNGAWTIGTAWTWVSGPGPSSTVGCYLDGNNKYLRVGDGPSGNTAMARRSIPENLAKPGATYHYLITGESFIDPLEEIYFGFREWSTGVESAIHFYNGPTPYGYGGYMGMPVNINPSDTYLFLQCSDCKVEYYRLELYTGNYRVDTRTVTVQPGNIISTYRYQYDNASPNTADNSAAAASGGTLYSPKMSDLRGNAMSQVVNPEGLATVNWFYQTDALKGRIYDTLVMRQAPDSFDSFDFINSDNWIAEGDTPISVFPSNSFDLAAELINPVVDGTVSFTRSEFSLISGQMAVAHVRLSEEIPGENNAQGEVGLVGLGGEYLGIYFQNGVATASDGTVLLNLGNFTKDEWYGVMFFVDQVNGSRIRIWQLDNPNNFGETVVPGVGAGAWAFQARVDDGAFWLDSYFEGVPYTEAITRYNTTVQYDAAWVNDNNLIATPTVFQDLQVVWNTISSVEQRNYNGDAKYVGTKQVYEYDTTSNYGNLLRQTDYANNNGALAAFRGVKYEYQPNVSAYIVSLPARQVTLDCSSGSCDFTNLTGKKAETYFFYDNATVYTTPPNNGKLTRQRVWVQNTNYSQMSFGYDTYGNQTSQTAYTGYATATQSTDPTGAQTTTTAYDTDGYNTYPISVTNLLGQVTQTKYDYAVGLPNKVIDPNSNPNDPLTYTSATYDGFGRMKTITAPLDGSPTLQVTYYDTRIPFQVDLVQAVNGSASIRLSRFYDGAGRQIQTQAVGSVVNGTQKNIVTDYLYNSVGQLWKQSVPNPITYNGSPTFATQNFTQATVTAYDFLGRTLSVTQPNTNIVSYAYGDLTTTVTDPKQYQTTTTTDVWGRTTFVDAPAGPDVTYTYDVLNQLATAVRGGKTTTIHYDATGHKVDMTDPDMGFWQYQYDAVGNLKVQTDNRGCVLNLGYDNLNRLTTKTSSGAGCNQQVNITYGYDDVANGNLGKGRRTSMTDGSGSTAWTYDARGRMIKELKNIDTQSFTTQWTYNSADLPVTMTYPVDNEILTYGYNSDGSLNSVTSSLGDTYLASTKYDEAARILSMDYGASILRKTFTYFPWNIANQGGLLNTAVTTRLADSTTLQSFTYAYDKNANVSTIIDNQAGPQTQTFGYDSLNRLTSAVVTGGSNGLYNESYQYNATSGNLSVKGGLTYSYNDPNHAHAVTNAGSDSYVYDSNGNMTQRNVSALTFNLAYDAENHLVSVTGNGLPPTSTPSPSSTPSQTATQTATKTNTPSLTPTKTNTPIATATFTSTLTASLTSTATLTPSGPTATPSPSQTFTLTPSPTNTGVATATQTSQSSNGAVYLSLSSGDTVGGVAADDLDILYFDGANWSMFFDASDVGITEGTGDQDLNDFQIVDADTILLTFDNALTVQSLSIDPNDIVQFDAASLGDTTAGTFSIYFDGSDVGLDDTINEIIDALDILSDGRLLLSTIGDFSVPGLTGKDEDLLVFTPTTLGDTTSGTWAMYFDGSITALGLGQTAEDIDGLEIAANGNIYLTTADVFAVTGVSGDDEDIFICTPTYTSGAVTSCTYPSTLFFDGSAYGLAANDVDAINLPLGLAAIHSPLALNGAAGRDASSRDPVEINRTVAHFASYNFAPPQQSGSVTFTPTADAYVAGDATTTNYGSATTLRADASPDLNSYLRFNVQGLTGSVISATLRIYANSASSVGYTVHSVTDNTWTESTITYGNAPAMGSQLGSSGTFSAGTWTSVNVTSYITGNGVYNLAFTTTSNTNISFASRELGANGPQLVIETSSGPTITPTVTLTPTKTPTPVATNTSTAPPTATPTPQPPFSNATFVYDGDGKRVKSTINGTITTYFVGAHYEVANGVVTKYYYAGTQRIAMRTNGTLNYVFSDHLGSTSLTTDANGYNSIELRYKAWGEMRYASDTAPTKYTYTGQYSYASDFGLMYYGARWYDSSLGRFAQADTILPQTQGVQAWDRYAYVNNNPIRYSDPTGHCIWDGCVAEVVTVLAVAVYVGYTVGEAMLPESQRHNLGAFGDSVPDASYTSYSISISKGTKEKDFWVGSIDIVQTKKQVGIFTSQSTLNPIDCASPCIAPKEKTSYMVPGISITKTKGILYGDELKQDVKNYSGGTSVGSFGGGGPIGVSVEGFSSTNPNTGKKNHKIIGGGASIGFSVGLDPYVASYYSWAKPRWIFNKPWIHPR